MEILFENHHVSDQATIKELYRYMYFKRPLWIVFDVILGVSFIANLINLLFYQTYYSP